MQSYTEGTTFYMTGVPPTGPKPGATVVRMGGDLTIGEKDITYREREVGRRGI